VPPRLALFSRLPWRRALAVGLALVSVILALPAVTTTAAEERPGAEPAASRGVDLNSPEVQAELRRRTLEQISAGGTFFRPTAEEETDRKPDLRSMNGKLDELRQRLERRKADRDSSAQRSRRQRSRSAFADKSKAEALQVARSEQARYLTEPLWRPLDLAAGQRVLAFPSATTALIDRNGGTGTEPALAESSVPLRSELATGRPQLADLSLKRDGQGWEPENPLVRTRIDGDASKGVELNGIRIRAAGGAEEPTEVQDKLFFANVKGQGDVPGTPDTDLVVTPQPQGVQFAWQLRSPASLDKAQSLQFDLPAATELRAVTKTGGAEVVRGSKRVFAIQPPAAWDADGEAVPASYEVAGDTLKVKVDRPDGDWAYPLMLDPDVVSDIDNLDEAGNVRTCGGSYNSQFTTNGWTFSQNPANRSSFSWIENCGLLISAPRTRLYNGGNSAQWQRRAFRRSYIGSATLRVSHLPMNSCVYEGLYDYEYPNGQPKNAWNTATWQHPSGYLPAQGTSPWYFAQGTQYSGEANYRGDPCVTLSQNSKFHVGANQGRGNSVIAGLSLLGQPSSWDPIMAINGAAIYQQDFDTPQTTLTHSGLPPTGTWTERATPSVTVRGKEPDPGLGVRFLDFVRPVTSNGNLYGSFQWSRADRNCSGAYGSRCPDDTSQSFSYDTGLQGQDSAMPEGTNTLSSSTTDILAKASPWSEWQIKVDRTPPPAPATGGSLYDGRNGFVTGDSYTLSVAGDDGADRSGTKSVGYTITPKNSSTVVRSDAVVNPNCSATGCSRTFQSTFNVDTSSLNDGAYVVTSKARDQLEHLSAGNTFEITVDRDAPTATVSPSQYPTWYKDGASVGTTVTGSDAGAGIKSFSLAYPLGAPDSVTRNCDGIGANKCLSNDSQLFNYTTSTARFAEGRSTVNAKVKDAANRESAPKPFDIRVDRSSPEIGLSGTLYASKNLNLLLPSYNLHYDARDGSTQSAAQERSGAKRLKISVRSPGSSTFVQKYDSQDQACAQSSCAITGDWTFNSGDYPDGKNTIRVEAIDHAGNTPSTKDFDVYVGLDSVGVPNVNLEDRLGLEDWWHYDSVDTGAERQAHVNLATGNAVWHSTPIVNPGRGLSAVMNLTYNSQESKADALRPENLAGDLLGQYNEAGRGFSVGISGLTRLNEPLDLTTAPLTVGLTDVDGTRHTFTNADATQPGETYKAPPGLNLRLRRFSQGLLQLPPNPALQLGPVDPKYFAITRPDGVTHFFDQFGYQRLVEDRNSNVVKFEYEYRSPTRDVCQLAESTGLIVPPDNLCVRKVVRVRAPGEPDTSSADFRITYKQRTLDELTPEVTPIGGILPGMKDVTNPSTPLEAASYASGPIASITDRAGRTTAFGYESGGTGYLTSLTEASGAEGQRTTGFAYEPDRPVLSVLKRRALTTLTDPRGNTTQFSHDTDSPAGGVGELGDGIISRKRTRTLTKRSNKSRSYAYQRRVEGGKTYDDATVTDARSKASEHRMDDRGRPKVLTDARQTKTELTWDNETDPAQGDDNKVAKVVQAAGTADEATTEMTYDANGQLLTQSDPKDSTKKTTLTYDRTRNTHISPRPTSQDSAGGFVSDLTNLAKPGGNSWSFGLDTRGNQISQQDPLGNVASSPVDGLGRIDSETDEEGNVTDYDEFDLNGQPQKVTDPRGKIWKYTYDNVGNVLTKTDPRGTGAACGAGQPQKYQSKLTYDGLDRPRTETTPKKSADCQFVTRQHIYDPNGNATTERDGQGQDWTKTFTAMDRPQTQSTPATPHAGASGSQAEVTSMEYDNEENLTKVIRPKGLGGTDDAYATLFTYDDVGQKVVQTRRSRGAQAADNKDLITSFAYDRRGNVVGVSDPRRNQTGDPLTNVASDAKRRFKYAYDDADNRTDSFEDPGAKNLRTHYEFDANDNLASVTDPRAYGGDPDDHVDDGADDFKTSYSYNEPGGSRDLPTSVIDGEGRETEYERRKDGKVSSITKPKGTASGADNDYKTELDYWPTGELKSRTLPYDDEQYGSKDLKVRYGKDGADQDLSPTGDPLTITDARGKEIHNTYLDSGELETTDRPSWWKATEQGVQEKSPEELLRQGQQGAHDKPSSEGQGDGGEVEGQQMPGLMPKAGSTTVSYDNELRPTQITDTAGNQTDLTRDAMGRVNQVDRDFNGTTRITDKLGYDLNGNPASETEGENNETTRGFDQFDRKISETRPGSGEGSETTTFDYDVNSNLEYVNPARANSGRWHNEYDELDRRTAQSNPEDEKTSWQLDEVGNPEVETSPRGNDPALDPADKPKYQMRRVFDEANQMRQRRNGSDHTWNYGYDANGNQTEVDGPPAQSDENDAGTRQVTKRRYDGRDLLWRETSGSDDGDDRKRTRSFEHDPNGMLRREVNPEGHGDDEDSEGHAIAEFEYDSDSDIDADTDASKNATVNDYEETDPSLRSSAHLPWGSDDTGDGKRYTQDFGYNARGWVISVTAPHEGTPSAQSKTSYDHYDTGWIKTQTDSTQALTYTYDKRGKQTSSSSDKGGRSVSRTYWPSGLLKTREGSGGSGSGARQRANRYDYNKNRSLKEWVDCNTADSGCGSDANVRRSTTIKRDRAERELEVDESQVKLSGGRTRAGKDSQFTYDKDGHVDTRLTDGQLGGTPGQSAPRPYPNGKQTDYDYDELGRERTMTVENEGEANRVTKTDYWESGQRQKRTTDRDGDPKDTVEREFYFSDGKIARKDRKRQGASSFAKNQDYDYDVNGNRTKDERGSHNYNARDQLTKWTASGGAETSYALNGTGNIASKTAGGQSTNYSYAADGQRLTSVSGPGGTTTPNYNDNGEMTDDGAGTTYQYDPFGRMTQASTGGQASDYDYDGLDRRETQTRGSTNFDSAYIGTSEQLSSETQSGGGSEERTYDYSSDGERLGMARRASSSGDFSYSAYSKDANGSVEYLEDEDGERDGQAYAYDPYGQAQGTSSNETNLSQAAQANPFRFEGHRYDPSVKTYDMGARAYRPDMGRFTAEDRFEDSSGELALESDPLTQERYAFAGGNPVNLVEFDGHATCGGAHGPSACESGSGGRQNSRAASSIDSEDSASGSSGSSSTCGDACSGGGYETGSSAGSGASSERSGGGGSGRSSYAGSGSLRSASGSTRVSGPSQPSPSPGNYLDQLGRDAQDATKGIANNIKQCTDEVSDFGGTGDCDKDALPNGQDLTPSGGELFPSKEQLERDYTRGDPSRTAANWTFAGFSIIGFRGRGILRAADKGGGTGGGGAGDLAKARNGLSDGERAGVVRQAHQRKGNYGLGSASRGEAAQLGKDFVGPGYRQSTQDPGILISKDGLRQYRPPRYKPRMGRSQANFERRFEPGGMFNANGHLDIEP